MTFKVRALLFDYDGLLVDTEWAEYQTWSQLYVEHGAVLELDEWLMAVGHVDNFDPRATLETKIGRKLDWAVLDPQRARANRAMVEEMSALPGARELMERGRDEGWKIGVVSNSVRDWVEPGLTRLGLRAYVDALCTRGDAENVKPDPAPYLHALELLQCDATSSFAFEDSGPGVRSAHAAGLIVVAVPNRLTRYHDLSPAHFHIHALTEFSLDGVATSSVA